MTSRDAGYARLIIPSNVDRDSFIRKCYDTGRVAIFTYGAGVLRNVSVCKHCVDDLVFPLTSNDYGCVVLYIKNPNREEYTVYGVLKETNEVFDTTEHQFSVGRKTDSGIAMISGDADDGSLTVTVNHNKKGGTLTIVVGNDEVPSLFQLNVSGSIKTDSNDVTVSAYDKISFVLPKTSGSEITKIEYVKGDGFSYSDEFGNTVKIDSNSHIIKHKKKVSFGNGKEALVLGDTALKLLQQFAAEIAKSTTATALGTMPLNNAAEIAAYANKFKTMLSKYASTQ